MRKPPAFQVYTKDFDTDENVMLMDCEQEGAYSRLLRVHWREGSVPESLAELAVLVRLPSARFTKHVWPLVGRCFVKQTKDGRTAPEGRLINPRMARDQQALAEFRQERSESGRKGNVKRWSPARSATKERGHSEGTATAEGLAPDRLPFSVLQSPITATENGKAAADATALSPIQLEDGDPGNGNGNGNGRTEGKAFPATRAAAVYRRHYPKGDVPKPMFRALKPLAIKHGWEAVEPELEAYLAATDVQFHNWPKFASGFGSWASSPGTAVALRPGVRASAFPSRSERNEAAAQEYLRTRAAREGRPS